jgi:hypothetical protein
VAGRAHTVDVLSDIMADIDELGALLTGNPQLFVGKNPSYG